MVFTTVATTEPDYQDYQQETSPDYGSTDYQQYEDYGQQQVRTFLNSFSQLWSVNFILIEQEECVNRQKLLMDISNITNLLDRVDSELSHAEPLLYSNLDIATPMSQVSQLYLSLVKDITTLPL